MQSFSVITLYFLLRFKSVKFAGLLNYYQTFEYGI